MLLRLKYSFERVRWAVVAYAIALKYVFFEFVGKRIGLHSKEKHLGYQKHNGRKAIVTGGSRGIGLEIVNNLLEHGYDVIIGSSGSEESRNSLQKALASKYPQNAVDVWYLDLASMQSVKTFVEDYLSTGKLCHLLINNAGIMFVKEEITTDGHEKHFSVNYLGHCLMTHSLLPLLSASGSKELKSRIINCTSCIHFVGRADVGNFKIPNNYSKYKAYIDSKLAQVMFTYSLQNYLDARNSNVSVNCVHPGVVNTELMTSVLLLPSLVSFFFKSAKEGAQTATYAALSSEMEGVGGKYLEECSIITSSKSSQDIYTQNKLWRETWKALNPWLSENEYKLDEISLTVND